MLSFACYRRKTIYLWNVWRPILHVLFYWPLPYFAGLLVWIRATNVPNFSQIGRQISELLRVKVLDIPHQLWTAYLSQMRPSPIEMKPVPDERPGAMSHWGNGTKILRASFSSSGRWKLIFTNVWPLITYKRTVRFFLKNIINCKYGPKVSLGTIFNPIGEGHLLSFSISLFIRRRLQTHFQPLYLHMYCMQCTPIWHKYVPS